MAPIGYRCTANSPGVLIQAPVPGEHLRNEAHVRAWRSGCSQDVEEVNPVTAICLGYTEERACEFRPPHRKQQKKAERAHITRRQLRDHISDKAFHISIPEPRVEPWLDQIVPLQVRAKKVDGGIDTELPVEVAQVATGYGGVRHTQTTQQVHIVRRIPGIKIRNTLDLVAESCTFGDREPQVVAFIQFPAVDQSAKIAEEGRVINVVELGTTEPLT